MPGIECSKIYALDLVFVNSGQNFAREADCSRILEEYWINSKAISYLNGLGIDSEFFKNSAAVCSSDKVDEY